MVVEAKTNGPPLAQVANAAPAAHGNILELSLEDVIPSPLNRKVELADLGDLPASIGKTGQQQPGKVRRHPALPGKYECLYGHRRLMACRVLGIKFRAELEESPLSDADIIKLQLTENMHSKPMSFFEIAERVEMYIVKSGCRQCEAASLLDLDETLVSKAVTTNANICPAVRSLVESGQIGRTASYYIATLPDGCKDAPAEACPQQEVARKVIDGGMKRDALEKLVRQMRGKKSAGTAKPVKLTLPGLAIVISVFDGPKLSAALDALTEAMKKREKLGMPWEALPHLLK